ncbi:unnamed protein product [Moneuplotes crassus]|uniref:Uncharacterized protein n=1 Tax=Euplotes crassus TaxID=5936 RepID=A0AAD1X5N6_EUPCR|nr:unnamed protein product [Moneuplotes crassus]
MDKLDQLDDALRKKNYHVIEAEDRCDTIPDLEYYQKQFMLGAKNICMQYFNKRPYQLNKEEYKKWLVKCFSTYDTIDTTFKLKEMVNIKTKVAIDTHRRYTGNDLDDLKDMNMSILENLIDRRSSINKVYKLFFLRYLSPRMRETIWKGILLDQATVKEYEKNITEDKSYTVSKDEIYILKVIQSILKDDFHNFGNDYDLILLVKAMMIYAAEYLNTYLQDFHYYMLFPLLQTFKSYRTYTRGKLLMSFYLSFLKVRMQIVDEVNEKDETVYEAYINHIIENLQKYLEEIDPELNKQFTDLLSIDDEAIKTYHMDLLVSTRGENNLANLDLRMTKQKVIFGELLRGYIERCSVGFVNVKVSCVIWDFILLKENKSKEDLFITFALILKIIKQDVLDCNNIIDLERVFRAKAILIDDYDFFCNIFDYSKDKNWKDAFSLLDGESLRANFMSIDRVRADHEAEKIREYEEQKAKEAAELNLPMNPSFNPMAPPSTQGGLPDSQPMPTHKPILTQSASNMNKAIG